jgi:excisionase family DNA binding protein
MIATIKSLDMAALIGDKGTGERKHGAGRLASVFDRFQHFHALTDGDSTASAVLVLAEAIRGPDATSESCRLLSIEEVAQELRVSPSTVRNLIDVGKLAAQRIGTGRGRIRIRPDELERFQLEAEREASKAPQGQTTLAELRELVKGPAVRPRRRAA